MGKVEVIQMAIVQLKKYKWKWIAICNKINANENGRECAI